MMRARFGFDLCPHVHACNARIASSRRVPVVSVACLVRVSFSFVSLSRPSPARWHTAPSHRRPRRSLVTRRAGQQPPLLPASAQRKPAAAASAARLSCPPGALAPPPCRRHGRRPLQPQRAGASLKSPAAAAAAPAAQQLPPCATAPRLAELLLPCLPRRPPHPPPLAPLALHRPAFPCCPFPVPHAALTPRGYRLPRPHHRASLCGGRLSGRLQTAAVHAPTAAQQHSAWPAGA